MSQILSLYHIYKINILGDEDEERTIFWLDFVRLRDSKIVGILGLHILGFTLVSN